jgi:hypothetical protein
MITVNERKLTAHCVLLLQISQIVGIGGKQRLVFKGLLGDHQMTDAVTATNSCNPACVALNQCAHNGVGAVRRVADVLVAFRRLGGRFFMIIILIMKIILLS